MTELLPLLADAPVLVRAAASDVVWMRFPTPASLAGVAPFALALPLLGWPEAGWRLLAAGSVLGIGLALWARGVSGAGDVKLLSALLLLVPSAALPLFANLVAASLVAATLVAPAGSRCAPAASSPWASPSPSPASPCPRSSPPRSGGFDCRARSCNVAVCVRSVRAPARLPVETASNSCPEHGSLDRWRMLDPCYADG